MIDCQVRSDHLLRLGALEIPRAEFVAKLQVALQLRGKPGSWAGESDGDGDGDNVRETFGDGFGYGNGSEESYGDGNGNGYGDGNKTKTRAQKIS